MTSSRLPLRRLFVEGLVIVVSILLAFSIDAWWNERQEAQEEARILETISEELDQVIGTVEDQEDYQSARLERIERLLSQVGPTATAEDPARFWEDLSGIIRTGIPLFGTGGIDGAFESGGIQLLDDDGIRRRLARWRGVRRYFEEQAGFTADYTDVFNAYLSRRGVAGALPGLRSGGSAFSPDPEILLRDPEFESQLVYLRAVVAPWVESAGSLAADLVEFRAQVDSLR